MGRLPFVDTTWTSISYYPSSRVTLFNKRSTTPTCWGVYYWDHFSEINITDTTRTSPMTFVGGWKHTLHPTPTHPLIGYTERLSLTPS